MDRSVRSTVWNWQDNSQLKPKSLRGQAVLQAAVMGAVGVALKFWWEHHLASQILWGLALLVLLIGFIAPGIYRAVHHFGQRLGSFVGRGLGYILLTPLYFLVFVPGAMILRLQKRDPMHRRPRGLQHTCWIARGQEPTLESYERQFIVEDKAARGALRPVGPSMPLKAGESA